MKDGYYLVQYKPDDKYNIALCFGNGNFWTFCGDDSIYKKSEVTVLRYLCDKDCFELIMDMDNFGNSEER